MSTRLTDRRLGFHGRKGRVRLLHVETDGCIVNIRVGLTDSEGRQVTSVEVLPDRMKGEEWHLPDAPEGQRNAGLNVRVAEGIAP